MYGSSRSLLVCGPRAGMSDADDELATIERLRIAARRIAFHPTHPQQRVKHVPVEPRAMALRREVTQYVVDFAIAFLARQGNEHHWLPDIAVVLRDLVFQNQVISERAPGKLVDEPV